MSVKSLGYSGDTIVEVMIALVIISTVIAGAFVASNRSLNVSRQAQERTEALKFVESQIEQIKANPTTADNENTKGKTFCFKNDGTGAIKELGAGVPSVNIDADGVYDPACISGLYNLSIVPSSQTYTVRARWERVGGRVHDEVRIIYRISP